MLRLLIENFAQDDWNRLVGGFPALSLGQCWEYAEAKARTGPWRVERGLFLDGDQPVGAFQALLRHLPVGLPGGLVWINRGPLWRGGESAQFLEMMGSLRGHYADKRGMYLRVAPPVPAGASAAGDMRAVGLAETGTSGWASAVLDLTPPEEDLRRNLKSRWRASLNHGERSGMEIRSGTQGEVFTAFLAEHDRLIADKGFAASVTGELLAALQDLSPIDRKMEVFSACRQGVTVASVLMAKYGNACEYLAGNLGAEGRRLNAGQFVLWRAIMAMKALGCRRFDVGGMDPKLTPEGIYKFKTGVAGEPYRLTNEVEAVGGGLLGRLVRRLVNRARSDG